MTKKKRTAAQFFDDAETYGLEPLKKTDLNSNKVSKHLKSSTKTIALFLLLATVNETFNVIIAELDRRGVYESRSQIGSVISSVYPLLGSSKVARSSPDG